MAVAAHFDSKCNLWHFRAILPCGGNHRIVPPEYRYIHSRAHHGHDIRRLGVCSVPITEKGGLSMIIRRKTKNTLETTGKMKTSIYLSKENVDFLESEHKRTRKNKSQIIAECLESKRIDIVEVIRQVIREEFAKLRS